MDDSQVPTQDEPVVPTTEPVETAVAEPTQDEPTAPAVVEVEEEEETYVPQSLPEMAPLDFSNLPVGEDNLIDPNALAGAINQQIAAAENRATQRANQAYLEQQAEQKGWEKAYEKYPELKTDKELKDIIHRTRLGEVTDLLSSAQDPRSVKLPSPRQVADKIFKYMGKEKAEGIKQATENTVIQASAHVETGGSRTNDSADAKAKAYQNINNPNKDVAKKARTDLLKKMLFGD